MKKILFCLLTGLTACLMLSCEGQSTYRSPETNIYSIAINRDTLKYGELLDTLYVGDTLRLGMVLNPYYNALREFEVEIDRNYLQDSIFAQSDYERYFDTQRSNPESGLYVFNPDSLVAGEAMAIPNAQFVALQPRNPASTRTPIRLILTSDLDVDNANPTVTSLSILIAEKDDAENNDGDR